MCGLYRRAGQDVLRGSGCKLADSYTKRFGQLDNVTDPDPDRNTNGFEDSLRHTDAYKYAVADSDEDAITQRIHQRVAGPGC